jgi:hypothetical protein
MSSFNEMLFNSAVPKKSVSKTLSELSTLSLINWYLSFVIKAATIQPL